jgi:hypothetical protein
MNTNEHEVPAFQQDFNQETKNEAQVAILKQIED